MMRVRVRARAKAVRERYCAPCRAIPCRRKRGCRRTCRRCPRPEYIWLQDGPLGLQPLMHTVTGCPRPARRLGPARSTWCYSAPECQKLQDWWKPQTRLRWQGRRLASRGTTRTALLTCWGAGLASRQCLSPASLAACLAASPRALCVWNCRNWRFVYNCVRVHIHRVAALDT